MSRIRANFITNRLANGAPTVSNGLVVSGVTTTTNLDITGNVSIGGTLTYEDVTNIDSVGIITAQSGIQIDDSISHIGDADTKIRFPLGDTITAQTGGNERVRIDSSGRVMIGTTTEGHADADDLTIATSGSSGITIRSGSSNTGRIFFSDGTSGNAEFSGFISYEHNNNALAFGTSENERLRIDSAGNIHYTAGGSTGSSDSANNSSAIKRIHLGNEYWSGTKGDYRSAKIVMYQTSNNNFYGFGISTGTLEIHGSAINFFNGGGTVKTSALDITSTGEYHFNKSHLYIKDKLGHHGNIGAYLRFPQNDTITFETNNSTERMRIDSSGRIGLGIANPDAYFSSYNRVVMGRTNDTGGMTIVSAPTSGGYISFADGTSGNQAYRGMIAYYHSQDSMVFGTDGGTERLRIDNSGRVLIGTSDPGGGNADDLTVATSGNTGITIRSGTSNTGNIFFSDATSGAAQYAGAIEFYHSDNTMRFNVGNTNHLRIGSSGQIGLGGANYGSSGQVLKSGGSGAAPTWGAGGNFTSYAIIAEIRSGTSDAGTLTANTWMTRAINTEIADPDGIVSISSNQFTLQAGTYLIEWSAPAWRCDRHTTRLYDVTNSAARGNATMEFSQDSGSYTQSSSRGFARVTISGATVYKLETKGNVTKTNDGLGIDPNNLASCIYAMAKIYKEV